MSKYMVGNREFLNCYGAFETLKEAKERYEEVKRTLKKGEMVEITYKVNELLFSFEK